MTKPSQVERENFSERLVKALGDRGTGLGPTELSRNFNVRWHGQPITVHAARKWLVGEAIPTQDKIRVLAEWLCVPVEWLRFGIEGGNPPSRAIGISDEDAMLLSDFRRLDARCRKVIRETVKMLLPLSNETAM